MVFVTAPELGDQRPPGARDFDFLYGSWEVTNRVLQGRLQGSTEWTEWKATLDVVPILGGMGNMDRFRTTSSGEYFEGVSLRLFDPKTERWAIYWMDTSTLALTPPLYGSFDGDRGIFQGKETYDDRLVDARFLWTRGTDLAHWEQAYSDDGGKTWEVNWTMKFRRTSFFQPASPNDGE